MPNLARVSILRRRVTDRLPMLWAWVVFASSFRPGSRRELWIGDSHAASFTRGGSYAMFLPAPGGVLVLRTGARLMYSLAKNGFPPRVLRLFRVIRLLGRPNSFAPVFVAGEIDVRNHLARHRDSDLTFVVDYVARAADLAASIGADRFYFVVPPPPASTELIVGLPHVGTDADRLAAFQRLRSALTDAVAAVSGATCLDFTPALSGEDGLLEPRLTDDGCHVNDEGRRIVRSRIGSLVDAQASG